MLYTKKEAARLLSVHENTVSRAMVSGKLKCRRIGTAIRFTLDDLEQYLGSRLIPDKEKASATEPLDSRFIPRDILKSLETEMKGISHGTVSLIIHIRDNHPRFVIGRERSFIQDTKEAEGSGT
jgi:excisionase family DNA binding protein